VHHGEVSSMGGWLPPLVFKDAAGFGRGTSHEGVGGRDVSCRDFAESVPHKRHRPGI
jgi:hypothetical protein